MNRFGEATSALIVRVLSGLFLFPAAAVVFVGVPVVLALTDLAILKQDGVDVSGGITIDPSIQLQGALAVAIVSAVVFVRACWAHRREPSEAKLMWPWLIVGGVLIACSLGATAIELGTSNLDPAIHCFCIVSSFVWLMLSLSWGTGRFVSRLLRRLEQNRPRGE